MPAKQNRNNLQLFIEFNFKQVQIFKRKGDKKMIFNFAHPYILEIKKYVIFIE